MAPRIALGGLLKLRPIRRLTLLCALSGLVVACDPGGGVGGLFQSADLGAEPTADRALSVDAMGGGGTGGFDAASPAPDLGLVACVDQARQCAGDQLQSCLGGAWLSLGDCPDRTRCEAGACVDDSCVPMCDRKVCGDDGCGSVCGSCEADEDCLEGRCLARGATCGDSVCDANESCSTCAADCGVCCGDGLCRRDQAEDCNACRTDCACAGDESCAVDGRCVVGCAASCDGRACGSNGCGGSCGACAQDQVCNGEGLCAQPPQSCGDNRCDQNAGEDCATCPVDCGRCCGDEDCDANQLENCATCPIDCLCDLGDVCDVRARACVADCVLDCTDRQCGNDGCGGSCGRCDGGEVCDDTGACVAICTPDCLGKVCGSNGCGGSCGACGPGSRCDGFGQCAVDCVPACDGRSCGDDGCGGSCGNCGAGTHCLFADGRCDADCVPNCVDRVCGQDGCGGSCGVCNRGDFCNQQGVCGALCLPNCQNKECGSNQCGGDCGVCDLDSLCDPRGRCELVCVPACDGRSCGDDGCGSVCGLCGPGDICGLDGLCAPLCVPTCNGAECGEDGCGDVCGACAEGSACFNGRCERDFGCNCLQNERCLDGICRDPALLCSVNRPNGLCPSGEDCVAGICVDRGVECSPANPVGICPPGELCRNARCEDIDDAALCDDRNDCTRDAFDAVRNRCGHAVDNAADCDDGNGCTDDTCRDSVCVGTPRAGCIAPPVLDPFVSPTNVNAVMLRGSKPLGSAVEINGEVAVPESVEVRWLANLNLVPGENIFVINSRDRGQASEAITVRIVYDNVLPRTEISPNGGVFLSGVSVTVASSEPSTVYYTTDGGTPDQYSDSFVSARTFRIFDDTTLKFRARDVAANWELAPVAATFTISGHANGWQDRAILPEGLSLTAAATLGTTIYVAAGTDGNAPQASTYAYDIATDAWVNLAALAVPRTQATLTAVAPSLYLIGGENEGIPLNFVQRYTPGAGAMWVNRSPMPSTRFGHASATVNGIIYVLGGKTNGNAVLNTHESYNPSTDMWSNQLAVLPRARYGHAAVPLNGLIYVVGGETAGAVPVAEVDIYNPATNVWTVGPVLPTPRSFGSGGLMKNIGAVAGQHNGILYAGGRTAGGVASAVVEELVLEGNRWFTRTSLQRPLVGAPGVDVALASGAEFFDTQVQMLWTVGGQSDSGLTDTLSTFTFGLDYARKLEDLPEGRFLHSAVSLDRHIYLFGGRDFNASLDGFIFDPETETYSALTALPSAQNGLASIAVDGRLYAMGGANQFSLAVPHNRSYDPVARAWANLRPMLVARNDAAIARLGSDIYVVGGENNGVLQTVEIYDTRTDQWRNGPLMPDARKGAMAVSVDDAIYVFGGVDAANAERNTILRFRAGAWANAAGSFTGSYGAAIVVGDGKVALLAGRRANALSNVSMRYDVATGAFQTWLADTQLLDASDRVGATMHNGDLYVFGGNTGLMMLGPSGLTTSRKVDSLCFNGVLDAGEGQGANLADMGGMCGNTDGCAVLGNGAAAAALARCQADGFVCTPGNFSVLGLRGGAGSGPEWQCNNADTWRIYCWGAGLSNFTCNANCQVGRILTGHQPCTCDSPARFVSNWCN